MSDSRLLRVRSRTTLRASLVAALLLMLPGRSPADSDVEVRLREIRQTWFSVDEVTRSFRYKYTMRLYRTEASQPLKLDTERIADHIYTPDGCLYGTHTYDYRTGQRKFVGQELRLTNEHYSCTLIDKSDDGRFILAGQPMMHDKKWSDLWGRDDRLRAQLPWLQPDQTFFIPDLLDPAFTQISKIENSGEGLWRISFRVRTDLAASEKAKLRGVAAGTLVLNRNKPYRLESAEIRLDQQSYASTYRLTYEGSPNAEYLLKGLESETKWIRKHDQVPMSGKQIWEYECRHNIDVDPRQFYMSHYGLPEPVGVVPPTKSTPRYVWFLAGAAVFAALALLFRWTAKRRLRTASNTPAPTA